MLTCLLELTVFLAQLTAAEDSAGSRVLERRDSFPVALDLTQGREFHCSGQRFDSWKQRDSELRAEQGGWGNSTWGQDKGGTRAIDLFHLQAREKNIHNHGTRFPGLQDTLAEPNKSAHRKNEDRRCGESWGGDTAEPQLCLGCRHRCYFTEIQCRRLPLESYITAASQAFTLWHKQTAEGFQQDWAQIHENHGLEMHSER